MAAKLAGQNLTDFNALANLEQQIVFAVATLQAAQNAYNTANPSSAKNVVAVSPNYTTGTAIVQLQLTIEGDSVLQALHENILAAIPAA